MSEWRGPWECEKCKVHKAEDIGNDGRTHWRYGDSLEGLCDGRFILYDRRTPGPEKAEACPGDLIANIHCPRCGVKIRVEHGDDPGEVGAISNTDPDPAKEELEGAYTVMSQAHHYVSHRMYTEALCVLAGWMKRHEEEL